MLINFNEYNLISIINKIIGISNFLRFLPWMIRSIADAPDFSFWIYIGNQRLRAVFSGKTHRLRKNLDFAPTVDMKQQIHSVFVHAEKP